MIKNKILYDQSYFTLSRFIHLSHISISWSSRYLNSVLQKDYFKALFNFSDLFTFSELLHSYDKDIIPIY